ncbi:hypothetical protein [Parapedobacter tibetensis]|uniref:hypothetical protein n=1 Tax=Parapedobacter tibetensis TaxID=2972951 RepID=UPI00214D6806|nr:hypothetical protein [Parapedobacter tibetensis]
MKAIKNIIKGVLSVAVLFMAVQVGVAQDKTGSNSMGKASFTVFENGNQHLALVPAIKSHPWSAMSSIVREVKSTAISEPSDKFKGVERALVDTYFEFTGTPGDDEGDPEMWAPSAAGGCSGSNASCKILVKSAYVGASPTRILLSEIDVVDGSPGNQVPNAAQAGPNPSQPFISIHNQP